MFSMLKDYFRLAYRNFRQRKLRSWLTMLGIFMGIAAIVSLLSLSGGLKEAIAQQFVQLGSNKVIVQAAGGGLGPPGTGVPVHLTIHDKEVIEKVKGVDIAVGRLIRIFNLEFNNENKYTYAVSYPKDLDERQLVIEANSYKIDQGKLPDKNDAYDVVVGYDFAQNFFEKKIELRNTITIQSKHFKVIGILKKSGNPQQDSTMVIPEGTYRDLLGIVDQYDLIPVQVAPGEDVSVVSASIAKELRKWHKVDEGKEDFTIQTPEEIIATLNTIITIIQGVLIGIAAISLVVGGIGIMNTMYTAVLQRTKEIGIMKAVGAQNNEIMFLFLIESGFIGFLGGLIGVILGFGISKLVEIIAYQLFQSALIKASFSPFLLIGSLLFAFTIGAASGTFPARQAAKLKPVDALRK